MSKIIGVLGGMGPEATADFFVKLIRSTPAKRDAEHLRVIIDSNPRIPDRTEAIAGGGPSPVPELIATARNLARSGARLIAIPCITAHHFIDEVAAAVDVPVLDALKLTARRVCEAFAPEDHLAILASTGTLEAKLFERAMPGRTFVIPSVDEQRDVVMAAVYGPAGVKTVGATPDTAERMRAYVAELAGRGARGVILGCTEFSVLFNGVELPLPVIDPMWLLAGEAVRRARD